MAPQSEYETDVPDLYDVNIPLERSRNTWVFSEKARQYGLGSSSSSSHAGPNENGSAGRTGKNAKRKRERGGSPLNFTMMVGS